MGFGTGFERNVEKFGTSDPEVCKQNSKNGYGGGYKTRMSNADSGSQFMKFQRRIINSSIGNWPRGHFFAILNKNLASSCLCLENLSDAELMSKPTNVFGTGNLKTS